MIITKEWLHSKNACREAIEEFSQQEKTDSIELLTFLINKEEEQQIQYLSWANWLIVRVMTYEQCVSYAIYAAKLVIHLFNDKYPDNDKPQRAIDIASKCLESPTSKNINACVAAAHAANVAVRVVYAAAHAAHAVYAAYAAAAAAHAAHAAYAAHAAAAAHAATAAYVAYAAAYAAHAAANAADAATAADAAYAAAYAAANAADANAAASIKIRHKILVYGINLLKQKEE